MCHVRGREEEGRSRASIFELVRVADRNQPVQLTMDDKGWARYVVHSTQIIELLGKKEA